jgi:hypothetical protein
MYIDKPMKNYPHQRNTIAIYQIYVTLYKLKPQYFCVLVNCFI